MAVVLLILVALSSQTLGDAIRFSFTKIGGGIYAETSPEHFAIFGEIKDQYGISRIVSVSKEGQYLLKPNCDRDWLEVNKISVAASKAYRVIRERYLAEKRGPKVSPESYSWIASFSSDDKREFSAVRLDSNTVAYSSEYFPKELARVIISGNVATFVHYDRRVVMKSTHCLYINEKILIEGIKKIDLDHKKSLFSSAADSILKKHLKSHGFNTSRYGSFQSEQHFSKTYTVKEFVNAH